MHCFINVSTPEPACKVTSIGEPDGHLAAHEITKETAQHESAP